MKLRVLISILFIIATTFTAIHELEHIGGEHNSSTCQVCVVDNHSVSADVVDDFKDVYVFSYEVIIPQNLTSNHHFKKTANHSNAPPSLS